jgi:hypothetical protein
MYKYKLNGKSSDKKLTSSKRTTEYNTEKNSRTIPYVDMSMYGNKFETHRTTKLENKEIARAVPSDKNINNSRVFWYPKLR